jgi:hypothetical protein
VTHGGDARRAKIIQLDLALSTVGARNMVDSRDTVPGDIAAGDAQMLRSELEEEGSEINGELVKSTPRPPPTPETRDPNIPLSPWQTRVSDMTPLMPIYASSAVDLVPNKGFASSTSAHPHARDRPGSRSSNLTQRSFNDKIRPRSRLRIRARASDGASSDTSEVYLPIHAQRNTSHGKTMTTCSSVASDIALVTPSGSAIVTAKEEARGTGMVPAERAVDRTPQPGRWESEEAKRLSSISVGTVTFGPI